MTTDSEKFVEMRKARLKRLDTELSVAETLDWARQRLASGWLLSEAPEGIVWLPLAQVSEPGFLGHCERLYIFGPEAEFRLQLAYGSERGAARIIEADDSAESGWERVTSYALGRGRLEYAELFCENPDSGLLKLEFGRYCGVRGA